MSPPLPAVQSLTPFLRKLIPACFIVGAGMELFMVKTGFYEIVTKNEAEIRAQKRIERDEYIRRKLQQESEARSTT